jgi:hypothetical protein
MPWCFVPAGLEEGPASDLGAETLRLWREGVYIIVVDEPLPTSPNEVNRE